mgnify:CR=1 FL=1
MQLPQDLGLEFLLIKFRIPLTLAESIKSANGAVVKQLKSVTSGMYDIYEAIAESEGPQAGNHYAWLNVALGNFYSTLNLSEQADSHHLEAWKTWSDPTIEVMIQKHISWLQNYHGF